jgi:hypothetical protein
MKIFQPELEDQDEGYATSFTFDNLDEQNSFSGKYGNWFFEVEISSY